jgi:hypothetical protein
LITGEYDTIFNSVNWELESQAEARKAGSLIVYCDPRTVEPKGSENLWLDKSTGDEWTADYHRGRVDMRLCDFGVSLLGFALPGRMRAVAGTEGNGDFSVVTACPRALDLGDTTVQGMADELGLGHPLDAFGTATLSFTLMHEIMHVVNPGSE